MLNKLTMDKRTTFPEEKVREMQATAAESILGLVADNPDMARKEAHIEHRWLKHYRKKAGISRAEMRDILFPDTDEFVEDIDDFEDGERIPTWGEFRTWADACGHTGGQITYYYLPYQNWFFRGLDSIKFWLWSRFDFIKEPKTPLARDAEKRHSLLQDAYRAENPDFTKPIPNTMPREPKTRIADRDKTTWQVGDRVRTREPMDTTGVIRRIFTTESSGVTYAQIECESTGIHYHVPLTKFEKKVNSS